MGEPPGAAQILVMRQRCWEGSPWGGQGQGGELVGAPAGQKRWAGSGEPCATQDRSPAGEPPAL